MDDERHIKGTHIINVIKFVKNKRGLIGLNDLFEKLNQGQSTPGKLTEDSFTEKDWYSYDLYIQFLVTADEITGNGDLSRIYEMGHRTVQNLGHLAYLTREDSVSTFLKNGSENWDKFYDFGKLEVVTEAKGKIVVRYHGFPEEKAKCEYFRGSITGMIEICGIEDAKVEQTACNCEDGDYCEFTIIW